MKTIFGREIISDLAYTYADYTILPSLEQNVESITVSTKTNLTKSVDLNLPIVGANMGHLGGRMAEKLAQIGRASCRERV